MHRIMVVDDEAIITSQMQDYLQLLGYEVAGIANSGEDAIESARKLLPDLILMDIVMPRKKIDGITASEIIKKELDIPVIFMTAYGGEKILERAKTVEPVGFIIKPFQENELKIAIEVALYRKEMERKLRESEKKYRSVVDAAVDAIFTIDIDGNVVFWNRASEALFGQTSEATIGKPFTRLLSESISGMVRQEMRRIFSGGHSDIVGKTLEASGIRKDGSTFPVEFTLTAWKIHEGVFFTIIARDITERKKIEQMKSDFVSLVSHQLKTPVAGIMGCIDNMLMGLTGEITDKQKEYLNIMRDISSRNLRIISNLLNVSRIERGIVSVNLQAQSLDEAVEIALKGYRDAMGKKGLKLVIQKPQEDILVLADRDKLVEALINSVENAVKFTDAGTITVRMKKHETSALVEIQDTGPGLTEEMKQMVFKKDRMFTGEPSIKEGCGLGLYTAMEFMKLQQGTISVQSDPGKGCTFVFRIPLANS